MTLSPAQWRTEPRVDVAPTESGRNPILDAVRDDVAHTYAGDLTAWFATSIWPDTPFGYLAVDPDEIVHARRVLSRIARLIGHTE